MAKPMPESSQEREIERLVSEIGRLIESAEPPRREELREFAATLLNQETFPAEAGGRSEAPVGGPLNLVAAGVGLLVLGVALALLIPVIGAVIAFGGLVAFLWGVAASSFRK